MRMALVVVERPAFPRTSQPAPYTNGTEQQQQREKVDIALQESLVLLITAAKIVNNCLRTKKNAKKVKIKCVFLAM